jgi:hypothetical protein
VGSPVGGGGPRVEHPIGILGQPPRSAPGGSPAGVSESPAQLFWSMSPERGPRSCRGGLQGRPREARLDIYGIPSGHEPNARSTGRGRWTEARAGGTVGFISRPYPSYGTPQGRPQVVLGALGLICGPMPNEVVSPETGPPETRRHGPWTIFVSAYAPPPHCEVRKVTPISRPPYPLKRDLLLEAASALGLIFQTALRGL